jgi:hypothetical protein
MLEPLNPLIKAAAELKPQATIWLVLTNIRTALEIFFYAISEILRLALIGGLLYLVYVLIPWTQLINQFSSK